MRNSETDARSWLTVTLGGEPLVPEPTRSTGSTGEVIAAARWRLGILRRSAGTRQAAGRSAMPPKDAGGPVQFWKAWKKTVKWQRLRWSVLVRDLFTCQRCRKVEADTSQLVADHIKAHKGDKHLFWDKTNLQCLCKPCHDGPKQSFERTGRHRPAIGADGWPSASLHPRGGRVKPNRGSLFQTGGPRKKAKNQIKRFGSLNVVRGQSRNSSNPGAREQ